MRLNDYPGWRVPFITKWQQGPAYRRERRQRMESRPYRDACRDSCAACGPAADVPGGRWSPTRTSRLIAMARSKIASQATGAKLAEIRAMGIEAKKTSGALTKRSV